MDKPLEDDELPHVHLFDFGGTVSVAGMTVSPNDVIHADRHGAVVIPPEAVKEVPAADLLAWREKVIADASKVPASRSPTCAKPSTSKRTSIKRPSDT